MILYGLIGFPLDHSLSAIYFKEKFSRENWPGRDYRLFPLKDPSLFKPLVESIPDLRGLNVTIPYKQKIIPFLDDLDDSALQTGAVNTIRIIRINGKILTRGYNTDAHGFLHSLKGITIKTPALILGTGGAAAAVAWSLGQLRTGFLFVSRSPKGTDTICYEDISDDVMERHRFIINATPLGMYPAKESFPPIPYHQLTSSHFLYDLVYNPPETVFLKKGREMNCRVMNGESMLCHQAELSFSIFEKAG
jgi:shikimate dehydrogenase